MGDAEAMLEALTSLEVLQTELEKAQRRADSQKATLQNVLDGGEIPSTGTGVARMLGIAPQKDREESIAKMKAELEKSEKKWLQLRTFTTSLALCWLAKKS